MIEEEKNELVEMSPEERLETALKEQMELIEREIDNINNRQIEVQSIISDLTNEIAELNNIIQTLQDPAAKYKLYAASNAKMELMSTYYSIYSSFEDTKFKYIQNRGDSNLKFLRQLHIDLVKINKDMDDTSLSASELYAQLGVIAKMSWNSQKSENKKLDNDDSEADFEVPESIKRELTYTDECKL